MRGATAICALILFLIFHFNPRAPCGARLGWKYTITDKRLISTHAPLAGRDFPRILNAGYDKKISTHAPLAGRDRRLPARTLRRANFNPRAPCGARQYSGKFTGYIGKVFQPTRPLRGATAISRRLVLRHWISTHAPLAGRDDNLKLGYGGTKEISTHAPLAGRDVGVEYEQE